MEKKEIMKEIERHVVDISLILNHEFGTEYANKLSPNQQLFLFLIGERNLKHVKDLAYYMNVSPSAISQMTAKLEKMNMVERVIDKNNRRNTVLTLGPEGKKMLEYMNEKQSTIYNKYLSKMSKEELDQLRTAFKSFYTIIAEAHNERGDHS